MPEEKEERKGFVFYKSFYEAVQELELEEQAQIYNAIAEYSLYGKEPELKGALKSIFLLIKPNIDASTKRYDSKVKNGSKGGRPSKTINSKEEKEQSTSNQPKIEAKPIENQSKTEKKPNKNLTKTETEPSKNQPVTKVKPTENIDKDIEVEEDKDIEVEEDKEMTKEDFFETAGVNDNVFTYYENKITLLTDKSQQGIQAYLDDGIEEGLIKLAIDEAIDNNARNFEYINTILANCFSENVLTVEQFKKRSLEFQERKQKQKAGSKIKSNNNKFNTYEQRNIDKMDFNNFYANMKFNK